MKIDAIYVACYKHDIRFTRILVASIRFWYPEIPILLVKDKFYGDFDTSEIEKVWSVSLLATESSCFGWGFSKMEPLFLPEKKRCLILDSDIVLVGPVLDALEALDSDFIVQMEKPDAGFVESHYFNLDGLHKLDPQFAFPGYTFNTGQLVATMGLLSREDFDSLVEWTNPPKLRYPDIFKLGEQGLLNYVLMKKHKQAEISLDRVPFMEIPETTAPGSSAPVSLSQITKDSPYQFVIHWCGQKKPRMRGMLRSDILFYFEALYYRQVSFGWVKKHLRAFMTTLIEAIRSFSRRYLAHRLLRLGRKSGACGRL